MMPLKRYRVELRGRRVNAIGIFYRLGTWEVTAASVAEAKETALALGYKDGFDHLSVWSVQELAEES